MANLGEVVLSHTLHFVEENQNAISLACGAGLGILIIRRWLDGGWCRSKENLHGKTVIITGASAGIGKETAKNLAGRGARVILACRNLEKAVKAANEIQNDAKGEIVVKHLDLASFDSIRKFAKEVLDTEPYINILINNAGVMCGKGKTKEGFDLCFGTNHLGHFLLTNLLLERLKKSAPARIITLSSGFHGMGRMWWDDLNLDQPKAYSPWKAYCQSKLANLLFNRELSRRLLGTGVTTYAVHPGFVQSELNRYQSEYWWWIVRKGFDVTATLLAKNPIQGAQTTIYCAVAEELQNKTGYYYKDCHESTPVPHALDNDDAKKLWDISMKMVGLDNNNESREKY